MLTAKKKINVREPISESSFTTRWLELQAFYQEKKKLINGIALAILAIVVIGYIYITNKNAENTLATIELGRILPLYEQQQYKQAIDGDPAQRIIGFKALTDQYSSSSAAEVAYLYLGNCYLYQGQYDNALSAYQKADPDGDVLSAGVMAGMGAASEGKKDFRAAAEYFEKAALRFRDDAISSDRLIQSARNYSLAGDKEKAKELYVMVRDEFKSPRYSREIERYLSELGLDS